MLTSSNNFYQRDMLAELNEEVRQKQSMKRPCGKIQEGLFAGFNSLCRHSPVLEDVPPGHSPQSTAPKGAGDSGLRGGIEGEEAVLS